MDVQPFKIKIPETALEDLQQRLGRTRWPGEIPGAGWDYGANLAFVREMVEYWRTGFNWGAQEDAMNAFDHFRAKVDGLSIHFIHQKGKGPDPLPLIITHGWPGTFLEVLKIVPLLADPRCSWGRPGGLIPRRGAVYARVWVLRPARQTGDEPGPDCWAVGAAHD